VDVAWSVLDTEGEVWQHGTARFWETIPDPGDDQFGNPLPVPDDWYQLPASHLQVLTDLTLDAKAALSAALINE
jgi:hypothetical protein